MSVCILIIAGLYKTFQLLREIDDEFKMSVCILIIAGLYKTFQLLREIDDEFKMSMMLFIAETSIVDSDVCVGFNIKSK